MSLEERVKYLETGIEEMLAKREAKVRVEIYMQLLFALQVDPKQKRGAKLVRILKQCVLGHGVVLEEGT